MKMPNLHSLVDLLRCRAQATPDRCAYTFLADGEREAASLTYAELDARCRAVAALLQRRHQPGERALLLYPPGIEFIVAFFGCLYAGVAAVPSYPPRPGRVVRGLARISAIARDAAVHLVLGTEQTIGQLSELALQIPELERARWLSTEGVPLGDAGHWRDPAIHSDTLAFLQYTSGSTMEPKGVMVSHGNLLHNLAAIYDVEGNAAESVSVSWLPCYHDMGLIGGLLEPVYGGHPAYLMSPAAFLQKPLRWLQAISRYRATNSGGPNFAYDLCAHKTMPEERQDLDLSSWRCAYNGAEPVRWETLRRFWQAYRGQGLRWSALRPVYGLAEATLIVAGDLPPHAARIVTLQADALAADRAVQPSAPAGDVVQLTPCGSPVCGTRIVIVHPDTCEPCGPDEIGEIWVQGPSVAQGYWNRPEESFRTFGARLAGSGEGPFLRTGDLGFLDQGELVVTGRIKDLIIVRGRKHYPQDIERSVEACHPAVLSGGSAAFSCAADGAEHVAVAAEVHRGHVRSGAAVESVIVAVREAVAERHGLALDTIVLLRSGGLPKTTSGKTQRHACRAGLHLGRLPVVAEWVRNPLIGAGLSAREDPV